MTDIFFDSDCISSFLWVNEENLLPLIYPDSRLILSGQVYDELSHPSIPKLKSKIDNMINNNKLHIQTILTGSEQYSLYLDLTTINKTNAKIIGRGEASAIVLAKQNNGILASNNMSDIMYYVKNFEIKNLTTADILVEAFHNNIIDKKNAEKIWLSMKLRNIYLPVNTFEDYLHFYMGD